MTAADGSPTGRDSDIAESESEVEALREQLEIEREGNPNRVVCPKCYANLPCESCKRYSRERDQWERGLEALRAQLADWQDRAERLEASHADLEERYAALRERLAEAERAMPVTFYSALTLDRRIRNMVELWNNAIVANEQAERQLEQARHIVDRFLLRFNHPCYACDFGDPPDEGEDCTCGDIPSASDYAELRRALAAAEHPEQTA